MVQAPTLPLFLLLKSLFIHEKEKKNPPPPTFFLLLHFSFFFIFRNSFLLVEGEKNKRQHFTIEGVNKICDP